MRNVLNKIVMGAVLFAVIAAGVYAKGGGDKTLLEQIKARGELVVGTSSGYPPYEFVDVKSPGQPVIGLDIELAQKIAQTIGVKLKVEDMKFDALLSSLPSKRIDIAIAGLNPNDERRKTMDFSDNYLSSTQQVMVRRADAPRYKTLADFSGKKISAEKGTTQEDVGRAEIPNVDMVALKDVPACVLELVSGKVDGMVIESVLGSMYTSTNPDLVFSDAKFAQGDKQAVVAMNKGNEDLLALVNRVIKEVTEDGSMQRWLEEYSAKAQANAQ
ncbi:MAG: transporter substrate-binding domain-containing protein [Spirochaetaceae bacterium]|jgi:polar amino acid transport system substrate-binding protein|nr:transporter substrate-binding domain-containing protein [Spirochaetaceae bacterium]